MALLPNLKPAFWDAPPPGPGTAAYRINYRRIWMLSVLMASVFALVPLITVALVQYKLSQHALASESRQGAARMVSTLHHGIDFFLNERRAALEAIVRHNLPQDLESPIRLAAILQGLKMSFGSGFVGLGIINAHGEQGAHVGLLGGALTDDRDRRWVQTLATRGAYISDVFLGPAKEPYLFIAVKQNTAKGGFQVLRAGLSLGPLQDLLAGAAVQAGGSGDVFLINREGVLQTVSRDHGTVLDRLALAIPQYHPDSQVLEEVTPGGERLVVGYRFIEDTPFVLMVVTKKQDLMTPRHLTWPGLMVLLAVSGIIVFAVILMAGSYLVSRLHAADKKRMMACHQVEYAGKMASIGRMAASVAHEINNPLAIINEKAGLIQDLFAFKKAYAGDAKLSGLVESILAAVTRAGNITKRLLAFARNLETTFETINIEDAIREVLSFLENEASLRSIRIHVDVAPETPLIESDRSKLQQIFINITNNAFAAMGDGSRLEVQAGPSADDAITIRFCDTGRGIRAQDLKHIFEPFYSSENGRGGTSLGLSITYNLTQEIGGFIKVESEVGKGTCFFVTLPVKAKQLISR